MPLTKSADSDQKYIPDGIVFLQSNSKGALGLSIIASGLEYQDVYKPLGISASVWTKIISSGTSNFPNDKIGELQKLVGNDIYIRWLANECDLDICQRKSTLEEELDQAQEKIKSLEHDGDLMRGLLTKWAYIFHVNSQQ